MEKLASSLHHLKAHNSQASATDTDREQHEPPGPGTTMTPSPSEGAPAVATELSAVPAIDPETLNSSFEQLPVEIHRQIMSGAPTLHTLSGLVHASPQLHRVYTEDRRLILRGSLANVLEDFLVDAHAAYFSGSESFQLSRDEPMLWDFVNEYKARRTDTGATADLLAQLSLHDVIQVAHFHHSIVEPLTERYATWALAALSSSPAAHPLSKTETQRIQRAMYRLQIFCNLCGSRGPGRSSPNRIGDDVQRVRILSLFPAWEVEEMLCFNEFAKDMLSRAFDQVAWDLDEERNPKYGDIDLPSVNQNLLSLSSGFGKVNQQSLANVLRQGLPILSAVIRTTDHDELVDLIRTRIVTGMNGEHRDFNWIDDAVNATSQEQRRELWYSDLDAAQDRRQKIRFDKDATDGPPLAWVLFWQHESSNLFGSLVPDMLRRWGFVMWNASRLGSGVKEYIRAAWVWRHAGYDPRDLWDYDIDISESG